MGIIPSELRHMALIDESNYETVLLNLITAKCRTNALLFSERNIIAIKAMNYINKEIEGYCSNNYRRTLKIQQKAYQNKYWWQFWK